MRIHIFRNEKEIEIAASLGPRRKRCSGFSASGEDGDDDDGDDDDDDEDDDDNDSDDNDDGDNDDDDGGDVGGISEDSGCDYDDHNRHDDHCHCHNYLLGHHHHYHFHVKMILMILNLIMTLIKKIIVGDTGMNDGDDCDDDSN